MVRSIGFEQRLGDVEHPPVEHAGETLLGAERDDEMTVAALSRPERDAAVVGERQRLADRCADGRRIGAHAVDPLARLAGARRGDPAHRPDHRGELPHRAYARDDVAEPLGHDGPDAPTSARTASMRLARWASSHAPVAMMAATASGASASSCAAMRARASPTFGDRRFIENAFRQRRQERHLIDEPQRREARLGERRADTLATRDRRPHAGVGDAAEAGEHLEFEKLRIVEPQPSGGRPQGGRLRLAADAADAQAHIDRGPLVGGEEARIRARSGRR